MQVAHILPGLNAGGAETLLYRMLRATDPKRIRSQVISMTDLGALGMLIQELGVPVRTLGMERGVPDPRAVVRLRRWLLNDSPDLVQGWLHQGNLLSSVVCGASGMIPHLWGVHETNRSAYKPLTRATFITTIAIAPVFPRYIVCCSPAAARGFPRRKVKVILNGVDTDEFKPDPSARRMIRRELRIPDDAAVVGRIARFAREKDYRTFIRAAGLIRRRSPEIVFIACGDGVSASNKLLMRWAADAGLLDRLHLLGQRSDVAAVLSALDVSVSSSFGEGLPLAVAESMACGVPCVATDVGDCGLIVGDAGRLVPPKDPERIAASVLELLGMQRAQFQELAQNARARAVSKFNLDRTITEYHELWYEAAARSRHD